MTSSESGQDTTPPDPQVIDTNACANCRRPIAKLDGVGWVHEELPQYAHEPPGCGVPIPIDPRCLACGQLVIGGSVKGGVKLSRHAVDDDGQLCTGSNTTQEWTT